MSPQVDRRQWQTRSFRVSCGQESGGGSQSCSKDAVCRRIIQLGYPLGAGPAGPPGPAPKTLHPLSLLGGHCRRGVHSRLGLNEAFKGFEEQRKLLAALAANLQVLLDEVICFFDRPPRKGQLGETSQFPQALVAGQLLIPRAADGLQQGADLVVRWFMA